MTKTLLDEQALMEKMRGTPALPTQKKDEGEFIFREEEKEKKPKKKNNSYDERFLKKSEPGKWPHTVAISRGIYNKLDFICRKAFADDIPMGTFIDNILSDHIDVYTTEFCRRYKEQDFLKYLETPGEE